VAKQDDAGNKRQNVEIQVAHVRPDLQFSTAEVTKASADNSGSSSGEEKQSASVEALPGRQTAQSIL
jgi:single-stranded DNA-binding protein